MRDLFNLVRYMARAGCPWQIIPHDLPPWQVVCQQVQRWIKAGCFEAWPMTSVELLRAAKGENPHPAAAILDGCTVQSTPESGACAGYNGYKRRKDSKVHIAVDTLEHLLALKVTAANDRSVCQVAGLAEQIQEVAGDNVELACVDQGYRGAARRGTQRHGIRLEVVKLSEARKDFVLLPRRWVVECSFGWAARSRRLTRATTVRLLHWKAFIGWLSPASRSPLYASKDKALRCLEWVKRTHRNTKSRADHDIWRLRPPTAFLSKPHRQAVVMGLREECSACP